MFWFGCIWIRPWDLCPFYLGWPYMPFFPPTDMSTGWPLKKYEIVRVLNMQTYMWPKCGATYKVNQSCHKMTALAMLLLSNIQGCQVYQMKIRETFRKVSKLEYSRGINVSKMLALALQQISVWHTRHNWIYSQNNHNFFLNLGNFWA